MSLLILSRAAGESTETFGPDRIEDLTNRKRRPAQRRGLSRHDGGLTHKQDTFRHCPARLTARVSQDEGDDGDVLQHDTEASFGKASAKLQILYL